MHLMCERMWSMPALVCGSACVYMHMVARGQPNIRQNATYLL